MARPDSEKPIIEMRGPNAVNRRVFIRREQFGKEIIQDDITRPDGSPGQIVWVRFTRPGLMVVPFDEEGNLLMIKGYQHAQDRTTLEFPGGLRLDNQTDEESVQSKVLEEAGLRLTDIQEITPGRPLRAITSVLVNNVRLFVGTAIAINPELRTDPTIVGVQRVSYPLLYEQATETGEIDNPTIITAIVRSRPYYNSLRRKINLQRN